MDGSQATLCSGFVLTMQTVALCGDTEKQYGGTGQVLVLPQPSVETSAQPKHCVFVFILTRTVVLCVAAEI